MFDDFDTTITCEEYYTDRDFEYGDPFATYNEEYFTIAVDPEYVCEDVPF